VHLLLCSAELMSQVLDLQLLISVLGLVSLHIGVLCFDLTAELVLPVLGLEEPLLQFLKLPDPFLQVLLRLGFKLTGMILQRLEVSLNLLILTLVLSHRLLMGSRSTALLLDHPAE
jgi:hypothetical protein